MKLTFSFARPVFFFCAMVILVVYCAVLALFTKEEILTLPFSFFFEMKVAYVMILCLVLTLPFIASALNEYRNRSYKEISTYLTCKAIINRLKKNGHGNPYTEDENNELDALNQKIKRIEYRIKIIDIILFRF